MALHVPHLKRALSTEAERQPPKRRVGPTAVIQVHADRIRRFIASNVRLGIPVRGTFDACDYDEDGILSMFDLKEVAQLLGMELAEDELQDLFQELDVDRVCSSPMYFGRVWISMPVRPQDGAISPKDFERFFSRSTDVGHKFFNTRKTKRGKAKLKYAGLGSPLFLHSFTSFGRKLLDAERRAAKRIEQRDEQHKRPALPLNAEAKRGRHTFGQTSARHTVHYHAKRKDWRKEEKEEADEDPDSSEDLTVTYRRTKWCLQLISA